MKKFISLLLVLTLSLSLVGGLGVTALAGDEAADAEAETALPAEPAETEAETPADPVPETAAPAPETETDADIPAEEAAPEEETALPELSAAENLPEEPAAGVEPIEETAAAEAQDAGTEVKSYTAAFGSATECSGNVTLTVGGSATVNPTVNASGSPKFKFSSNSDESVAVSSPTGSTNIQETDGKVITITGAAIGQTVIVYTYTPSGGADQGKTFTLTINVTVNDTGEGDDGFTTDSGSESGTTGGDSGSGSDSGATSVQYGTANALAAGMNVAFAVNGFTFGVDRGSVYVGAAAVADGRLTVETSNWIQTVSNGAGGVALVVEDPPGETTYLSIDAGGLKCEKTETIPGGSWTYADGFLSYTDGDTTYYITGASAGGVTTGTSNPAHVDLYTGTETPSKGAPPSSSAETDDAAPIIVKQPAVVPYVIADSGYAAPTYTVEAKLPEGSPSQSIYFQWYVDGNPVGDKIKMAKSAIPAGGVASCTVTIDELANRPAGMYGVYCEVICNTDGGKTAHTTRSVTVRFLICNGVQSNSFITFSDVHETFDNVGTAIYNTMMVNEGYVPALIICTGDWANGNYMGGEAGSDNYNATMDDYIARLRAQAAGIDMIFISGNHDNGAAAADATVEAGLGAEEGYDGLGAAYDSRKVTTGSSAAAIDGLVVFGINYDQLKMPDGGYSYANVLPKLEDFLKGLKNDGYTGKVVISAHAGLHVLGVQAGSSASAWGGGSEYNVDKSYDMVALINEYADDMDIMYFFGHDHSKGESEFSLAPNDTITSTKAYADKSSGDQTIKFYYGHAGYITNDIGGQEKYTAVSWDGEETFAAAGISFAAGSAKATAATTNTPLEGNVTITTNAVSGGAGTGGNTGDPGDTSGGGGKGPAKSGSPKTGDESVPVLWAAVIILCAGTAIALLPRRKKN